MNNSDQLYPNEGTTRDAIWILSSCFSIFATVNGFGLLESGFVSRKSKANAMMKNCTVLIFGSLTYWLFGYGLSYGPPGKNNAFCGEGNFPAIFGEDITEVGLNAHFVYQLSLALTATTIVSGAMAERVRTASFMILACLYTLVYSIPAHWIWGEKGWLRVSGAVDFAGSGAVHLLGGVSALVAGFVLGPRSGRYDDGPKPPRMGNASDALLGMFTLWWSWIGLNCGGALALERGKWIFMSRSVVCTILAAAAGGFIALFASYIVRRRIYAVCDAIYGVSGGLAAIAAGCALVHPWESLVIGAVGGLLAVATPPVVDRIKVDDPVGAFAVHGLPGFWGLLSIGLFADAEPESGVTLDLRGLLHGGGGHLLLHQFIAGLAVIAWAGVISFFIFIVIHLAVGLRLDQAEEQAGSDYAEHGVIPRTGIPRHPDGQRLVHRRSILDVILRKRKVEIGRKNDYDIEDIDDITNI